jgi:hypothetical protein
MRRPVKPFSVEVRRSGRRAPQPFIAPREVQTPREIRIPREVQEAPQPDYFTPRGLEAPEPPPASEQSPPRRVLQDLNEPRHDPLAERLQELESRLARRGRPRGSKNKSKRTRASVDLSEFFDTLEAAPAPLALVALPYKRRPREQRFAWIKKKLRRGERWKRRLPKILW